MLPHATPLPRTAASMLMSRPAPPRATPSTLAAAMLLFPCAQPDPRDAQRACLRRVIAHVLEEPRAVARLKAAGKICGADWSDTQRMQLLRALQQLPSSRCAALPAVEGLLARSVWSSPGDTLRWALEAEANGQLPVWAAHGILPRLERCKDPQRTVAQLRGIPGAQLARFWERVEALARGTRQLAALSMEAAVDACVRLPAAHVRGIVRAVTASGRAQLAPVALAMGLFPVAIRALAQALDRLPVDCAQDEVVVAALARAAQVDPKGLPSRLALAAALRLNATGLVAVCSVPPSYWESFAYAAQAAHRIGTMESNTRRTLAVQALAARQRPLWKRWLGLGRVVSI